MFLYTKGQSTYELQQVEVILPEDVYSAIQDSLSSSIPKPQYARVFMSLSSLLEGDFFNTYIKLGTNPSD